MPVSTPCNGITSISAAAHLLPLLELFAMQRACRPPTQAAAGRGGGLGEWWGHSREGETSREKRPDTFWRCSIDWIGYPPKRAQGSTLQVLGSDVALHLLEIEGTLFHPAPCCFWKYDCLWWHTGETVQKGDRGKTWNMHFDYICIEVYLMSTWWSWTQNSQI